MTLPYSDFDPTRFVELLDTRPVIFTAQNRPLAVLLDYADYQRLKRADPQLPLPSSDGQLVRLDAQAFRLVSAVAEAQKCDVGVLVSEIIRQEASK